MDSLNIQFQFIMFYKFDFYAVLIYLYKHRMSQLRRVLLSKYCKLDEFTPHNYFILQLDKKS